MRHRRRLPTILTVCGCGLLGSCQPAPELPPVANKDALERFFAPPSMPTPQPLPPAPGDPSFVDVSHAPWPRKTVRRLEERAAAGDASAAWDLATYYDFILHNERRGAEWLHRATILGHPEAQRCTAYLIQRGVPDGEYGASAPEAVRALLQDACRGSGSACYDLAKAFESGYFGPTDSSAARASYQRGAEQGDRMCWEALAKQFQKGTGGPVDNAAAYYWISLEARCVDPRSLSGAETWKMREALAGELDLGTLEQAWSAVDTYMAEYHAGKRQIYFDPFLGSAINDALRRRGEREADRREKTHRQALRAARAAPPRSLDPANTQPTGEADVSSDPTSQRP